MLASQKYANTNRNIDGLSNPVFDNDVILLCETLIGPISIDLQEIPADFWNTNYKLYIVDNDSNAAVNNITINAPAGYTVNNAGSLVLNINGARGVITISSNNSYSCELNYGGAGGGIIVEDEGVPVSSPCTVMNFMGNYVTAVGPGGTATVTINPSIIAVTFLQITGLIGTNSLVLGQFYNITDAIFTNTVSNPTEVVVEAITDNSLSLFGEGIFWNADYQAIGNYSGVPTFTANIGIWNTGLLPIIGDVVVWNNFNFLSITGVNPGIPPELDAVNWSQLSRNINNGYILEIDSVSYNVVTNQILTRQDKRVNYVENNLTNMFAPGYQEAFLVFQWGGNSCLRNKVVQESFLDVWNSSGTVFGNSLSVSAVAFSRENTGNFAENTFIEQSSIIFSNEGDIIDNYFCNAVGVIDNLTSIGDITKNHFESLIDLTLNNDGTGVISANYIFGNYGNIISIVNEGTVTGNYFVNASINVSTVTNLSALSGNKINNAQLLLADLTGNCIGNMVANESLLRVTGTCSGNILNNEVLAGSTIIVAQNPGNISNNIVTQSSIIDLQTNIGQVLSNNVQSGGGVQLGVQNDTAIDNNRVYQSQLSLQSVLAAAVSYNILDTSTVTIDTVNDSFSFNSAKRGTYNITTLNAPLVHTNTVLSQYTNANHNISVDGGIYQQGVGSIKYDLDMLDPAVFILASNTLVIPADYVAFFGQYNLINNAGFTIDFITNLSQVIPTTFTAGNGIITINIQPVAIALAQSIISNGTVLGPLALTNRVDGNDSLVIKGLGLLNGIEQINLYI